jgi:adenylosuccinate synthase
VNHVAVVDLGFGDAGKGTVVDWLCATRPVPAVIRFNGGAQAGHNVVTEDGRAHTFAQFGSGSLRGVPTFLSRFMVVDPLALTAEADHLSTLGVPSPYSLLAVDRAALVATPYHRLANQARELARGADRHGSCGMGVGETVAHALDHPDDAVRFGDLTNPVVLRRKLDQLAAFLRSTGTFAHPPVDDCVAAFTAIASRVRAVDSSYLDGLLAAGPCVFEGAQGVLLDEWRGFHPYTTWSTTTFDNVGALGVDCYRLGVLRCFTTRHGAGPMVTEDDALTAVPRRPAQPDRPVAGRLPGRPLRRGGAPLRARGGGRRRRPRADPPRRGRRHAVAADLPVVPVPIGEGDPSGTGAVPGPRLPGSPHGTAAGSTAGPGSRCAGGLGGRRGVSPRRTGGADVARPHRRRQGDYADATRATARRATDEARSTAAGRRRYSDATMTAVSGP